MGRDRENGCQESACTLAARWTDLGRCKVNQNTNNSTPKTFETLFQRLSDNWPLEPERGKRLTKAYYAMFQDVSEPRFSAAVTSIIEARAYSLFPTEAEFRAYIPTRMKREYCGKCIEGWIYLDPTSWKTRLDYGVRRCECAK